MDNKNSRARAAEQLTEAGQYQAGLTKENTFFLRMQDDITIAD